MEKSDAEKYKIYAKKMNCTSYDQDHCNVEKMGCEGCGHNLDKKEQKGNKQ